MGGWFLLSPRENKTYLVRQNTDYQGDFTDPKVTQDVDYIIGCNQPWLSRSKYHIGRYQKQAGQGLSPLLIGNSGSDYNGGDNR